MSFINALVIACSLIAIIIAFVILLCLKDCYITPNQAAHIIFTYDTILNQVYEIGDSLLDAMFCCCRTINHRVIPREEPIPIREIELTQLVIVRNPSGEPELGTPCKVK